MLGSAIKEHFEKLLGAISKGYARGLKSPTGVGCPRLHAAKGARLGLPSANDKPKAANGRDSLREARSCYGGNVLLCQGQQGGKSFFPPEDGYAKRPCMAGQMEASSSLVSPFSQPG